MKQQDTTKASLRLAEKITNDEKDIYRRKLSRTHLINSLNRINFTEGEISLQFRHNKYHSVISLMAKPQVCNENYLRCLWTEPVKAITKLKYFTFENLSFSDGLRQIRVAAIVREMNNNGIHLELPETCYEHKSRSGRRYDCNGIEALVSQDGRIIDGTLKNISPIAFAIESVPSSLNPRYEIDPEGASHLILKKHGNYIFSGTCKLIRFAHNIEKNTIVLTPLKSRIRRFKSKDVRSERLTLTPLPNIFFTHPLTQKRINLGLIDIAGNGFAVEEDIETSVLIPGLVIQDLRIEFMHGFSVTCKAQVVYRSRLDEGYKCGLAILDMNVDDHIKLSSYLHQAKNKHSYVSSTNIDLDALWDFFFETGFVYPEKYTHIHEQKDRFKELYKKLYNESPEIARHVIYQDKGRIYGHVSMLRYYQSTWLMHHHAALKSPKHKAGLVVMEHILQYINEYHTIPSAKMNYIACYFRPNNRFADRVFGGAARALEDQKKCSLDSFAYFHHENLREFQELSEPFILTETETDDLHILGYWYKQQSGGLMIEGLDLTPDRAIIDEATNGEYKQAGFKRDRKLYSLKNNDELLAVFIINNSELGMNMSELINCIQILILDPGQLYKKHLFEAITGLMTHYKREEVPILLYPETYAKEQDIPYDKTYTLTVLDLDNISPYLRFMKTLTAPRKNKNTPVLKMPAGA